MPHSHEYLKTWSPDGDPVWGRFRWRIFAGRSMSPRVGFEIKTPCLLPVYSFCLWLRCEHSVFCSCPHACHLLPCCLPCDGLSPPGTVGLNKLFLLWAGLIAVFYHGGRKRCKAPVCVFSDFSQFISSFVRSFRCSFVSYSNLIHSLIIFTIVLLSSASWSEHFHRTGRLGEGGRLSFFFFFFLLFVVSGWDLSVWIYFTGWVSDMGFYLANVE